MSIKTTEQRKKELLALENRLNKTGFEERFIINGVLHSRFAKEYSKEHRPISRTDKKPLEYIEEDFFQELGLNVKKSFFEWYLRKHCNKCDCEPCGCDKGCCDCEDESKNPNEHEYIETPFSPDEKTNEHPFIAYLPKIYNKNFYIQDYEAIKFDFYDIKACSEQLKNENMNELKKEYKNDTAKEKAQKNTSNEYYFAKIEYYIPQKSSVDLKKIKVKRREEDGTVRDGAITMRITNETALKTRCEGYAIIYKNRARIKPKGTNATFKIKEEIDENSAKILERYSKRPSEISKAKEEAILKHYIKRPKEMSKEQFKEEKANKSLEEFSREYPNSVPTDYSYAKIGYFIAPPKWAKVCREDFAIVYRDWAYIKSSGTNCKFKIKENPNDYDHKIIKEYFRRPSEMSDKKVNDILSLKIFKNAKLKKPN